MKKGTKIAALFLAVMSVSVLQAQEKQATFEDGTVINYEVRSLNPVDLPNMELRVGQNGRGTYGLCVGGMYTNPHYFMSELNVGIGRTYDGFSLTKVSLENTIFLKEFMKEKEKGIAIKSKHTGADEITKYVVKEKLKKRGQLGARLGYMYNNFESDLLANDQATGLEVSVGISYTSSKFVDIKLKTEGKRPFVTMIRRTTYFAELINIHGIKDNSESVTSDLPSSKTGFRAGIYGQAGGSWGLTYLLSAESTIRGGIDAAMGLGLYFTFM